MASSAVGTFALAGCIGGDGDGDGDGDGGDGDGDGDGGDGDGGAQYDVRMGTSAGGTMDVGLAFERAVSQTSDVVSYSTIESPGYVGSTYRNAEGLFEGAIIDTNTMSKAQRGTDMFEDDPVDVLPWQGFFGWPYSIYIMARADTDIQTFDDLAGVNFYPAEPGYSTRATTLDVLTMPQVQDITDQMNILNMDVADAPGAMEEGRIDAAIAYGTPGVGNTGWVVEYDSRVDVRYVEPTDALIEAAEEFPGAGTSTAPAEEYQWQQDIGTDEIFSWDLSPWFTFHHETPADAVYELCRVAWEEQETVREAEPRFAPREDPSDMVRGALPDYPFHPGAAQFYQEEIDAWEDDFVVGEEAGSYFM